MLLHFSIFFLILFIQGSNSQSAGAFGSPTSAPDLSRDVHQMKSMLVALQQQVAAIQTTLVTHSTMSLKDVCSTYGNLGGAAAKPKDCLEVQKAGNTTSGVYDIKPPGMSETQAYCDMDTDGGGWLVIQKRIDGSEDFYKTYSEYEAGFGNKSGEYWLGNRNIHAITTSGEYELLVTLEDFQQHVKTAHYDSFSVGRPEDSYKLAVDGYNGTAGDSLKFDHNGMKFSTHDADHDTSQTINCAEKHHGGYWYSNCFKSNVNGQWGVAGEKGIIWGSYQNWKMYVLKHVEMKIRPKQSRSVTG